MLKCLAFICLIGLAVSNPDWESAAQAGKKSQRMNLLSKTVGARMLAGTNGQMDTGFQPMSNTGNQFVPIPRQTNAAMGSMQQQQPFTGGQTMDNSLNNGQQLTPEQLQQLHQFLSAQTQSQQQQQSATSQFTPSQQQQLATSQFTPSQQRTVNTQQQQQQQQPMQQTTQQQPQQTFRMTDTTGMNPTGMSGVNPSTTGTGMDTNMFADQQTNMNNQFGQGRMMNPSVATAFPTTTPFTTPSLSKPSAPLGMLATPSQTQGAAANKPSALEQQLLDQQILTQKLKEQLLQQQQQQQKMQQQGKFQQQPTQTQPTTPDQTTMTGGFGGLSQATEQLTQEQKLQRMTAQQQQQQQQQLLDQINQLNKMNQQGRNTQTPGVQSQMPGFQQQTPGFQQQTPTGAVQTPGTQTPGSFQTPVTQTPGFGMQQPMMPTNTSRMMMNNQMRPTPTGMSFGGKGRVGGGDICSGAQPGELLPHPLDETQFIVCNELGEITLMDCPNHTVFNPHLKLCDLTSEMPLLCKANPCLNGAKCVEVSPVQFRCECPQGFSGKTCEKFDTCQSSKPCGSDGVCLSFALGSPIPHVCLCNGGRTVGLTCAQGEQNPCTFPGSSTKLMPVNFNRAVFAHCEGARPHFKFCQPPLLFSGSKQACEWTH